MNNKAKTFTSLHFDSEMIENDTKYKYENKRDGVD